MSQQRFKVSKRLSGLAVLTLVGAAAFSTETRAELAGDPAILKAAADQHKANRERIVTWQGKAKVEQRSLADQPLHSEVSFVFDAESGNYRWNWTIKDVPNDSWKDFSPGEMINGMLKDGKYYEYGSHIRIRSDDQGNELPVGDLRILPGSRLRGRETLAGYFDLMWHFTKPAAGKLENRLRFVADGAKHPKNQWEAFQKGDFLTLRDDGDNSDLQIKDADRVVNHYEIDLSQGANLTLAHYYSPKQQSTTDYRITWEQVNEVWVPKTFTYHKIIKNGRIKVHEHIRKVTWIENVLNQPLPEDAFTEESVGLRPGDRFSNIATRQGALINAP